ncbi:aldehyde ferredoxin oxidoreductase family protein [Desulfoprunum benzoelyticum]|uniref:Aldehyde:ferredoxin oxidoreductase n=1 Tax=Desulfoprunum benzoelyticum TaxID=1506996 RepID=A0A840UV98_9BACT|nr:aldehyde ferredoxin oxidoreductase family protein [Desulfoprunum benzoelyticum]MBB5349712.1 aldehyde:ferredoxin oxidoreductase [Desulfoprunum benzoelyticum]MBM9531858.1 aldehyde ferredoxin oxidoreductase family protein [Desulfoprunum benzoelyticum]
MHGFYNRILTIDLSSRTSVNEEVADEVLRQCLGGKGLATRLLLERNPAGVDPLAPENHLIFATGPFCGGRLWGGSRYGVFTKSPLTGFYAESYSGGKVPEAIDAAGFDAIVLHGRADRPTVLTVTPEGAEFHDADDLWGMETFAAEAAAVARFAPNREGYRKPGAVVIGPAGENLVRYAIIANDKWRCAGRAGVGTVMGAKLVKAIVFQGDSKRRYADPEGVAEYAGNFSRTNMENPGVKAYKRLGTTMMVAVMNTAGAFPARYWNQGSVEHWENLSGEKYHEEHEVKAHACAKCFMACGRLARLRKGRHKDLQLEGPEYETIYSFGGLCMITEMEEVAFLNDLADRLGMDTITVGNLCALVMEAREKGRIDYAIDYGNADQLAVLIRKIAAREDIGDILADGIIPASKRFGLTDLAIHVKGMEPAGYEPRVLKGMGLTFGTSPRGACHLRTTFYKPELSGMIPPAQIEDKAALLIEFENRLNIFDTLVLCRFYRDLYTWAELEKSIALVTGIAGRQELEEIAVRVTDMTRLFNIREGLTAADDRLPPRLHKEKLPDGRSLTADEMEYLLQDYYRLRGWDAAGVPAQR